MITIKTPEEIEVMRRANQVVAKAINTIAKLIKPGVTTAELDAAAEEVIRKEGARPTFKGYQGYPASICASINEVVVHGIPDTRRLVEGDIIGIDVGAEVDGYHGDAAVTLPVGTNISKAARDLLVAGREALNRAIAQVAEGNRLSDISHAVESFAREQGYGVVRDFVGHGIGQKMHEEPQVPNFGPPGRGPRLKAGMVLALEPMLTQGTWRVQILEDGWTVVTEDRGLACHFEHSVAITPDGPDILSRDIETGW